MRPAVAPRPVRRRSLLRVAASRLRHVVGCPDCLRHHVVARGRGLGQVP